MKELSEYIEGNIGSSVGLQYVDFCKKQIAELFDAQYIDSNSTLYSLISENLMSHNVHVVIKKLKETFPDFIDKCIITGIKSNKTYDNADKSNFTITVKNISANKLAKVDNFNHLLAFYNYYITEIDGNNLLIEPVYSEDKTNYVQQLCHSVCYHFTTGDKLSSILKNGLRCKEKTDNDYRTFPNRIYLLALPEISLSKFYKTEHGKEVIDFIMHNMLNKDKLKQYGLCILKVDVKNVNSGFYDDGATDIDEAVFTYANIPATCIEEYKINL